MKIQAIEDRRSIRKFKADAVPQEMLARVLEAARIAPSSKNDQPWEFHIWGPESRKKALAAMENAIRERMAASGAEEGERRKLAGAVHTLRIMKQAPVLIGIVRPEGTYPFEEISGFDRVTELLEAVSVGAAVENMLLEACALGLGTLWIGYAFITYDAVCSALGLSGQLMSVVALGWPDENPAPRPRKSLEEIVRYLP